MRRIFHIKFCARAYSRIPVTINVLCYVKQNIFQQQNKILLPFVFALSCTVLLSTAYDDAYSVSNICLQRSTVFCNVMNYFPTSKPATLTIIHNLQRERKKHTYWPPSNFISGETDQRFVLVCNAFILESQ